MLSATVKKLVKNELNKQAQQETLNKITQETLKAAKEYAGLKNGQQENQPQDLAEESLHKIRTICGNEVEPVRHGVTRLMEGQIAVTAQMEKLI